MNSEVLASSNAAPAPLGALDACRELVLWWSCRLSGFGALNWADDPALLALVFC